MNCNDIKKKMSPYLDSELDHSETFEISQHLERCAPCARRFASEAHIEGLIVERYKQAERLADWHRIEQRLVHAPGRMRLRPAWMLAAAACIAFVVIGFGNWPNETRAANPAQWYADELYRKSPDCGPFVGSCTPEDIARRIEETLECNLKLPLHNGKFGHHPVEFVSAVERACPGGSRRVEIQLNCCGKPMLLTVGRCHRLGELEGMRESLDAAGSRRWAAVCESNGVSYNVAACRVDDLFIAVVGPDHAVDPLMDALAP